MTFQECVNKALEFYPEFQCFKPIEVLERVEVKLVNLARCDDVTACEREKLALLPVIKEFLR